MGPANICNKPRLLMDGICEAGRTSRCHSDRSWAGDKVASLASRSFGSAIDRRPFNDHVHLVELDDTIAGCAITALLAL